KGINTSLPDAKFKKEEPKDKLGFYAGAEKDTANNENEIRDITSRLAFNANDDDPQTEKINQKLEALDKEINKPVRTGPSQTYHPARSSNSGSIKNDVDRLEALMRNMQRAGQQDPEMEQLDGMMNKILDLQHPERLREKYEAKALATKESQFQAIPALIEGNQKVTHGSVIKFRLKDSIILNGYTIPKNQLIYGTCLLSNQRILLDIKTIRLGTSILPVNLSVYDLDGMKGINAPEAVLTETMNNGANNLLGDIQLMTMDQSLATQMAGAGLDAAKSLLSKKLKRIKVKLKAGQTVLLRNNEQRKRN
ncbi:MAG TPA: conjugative transposon protein TraM, partial [Pedobacter sp.]